MSLKPYTAEIFDGWWRWLLRYLPLEGVNCTLDRGDYGTIIGCSEELIQKHPWWVTPRLQSNDLDGTVSWVLEFEPAFVNGADVLIFDQAAGAYVALTDETPPVIGTNWRDGLRSGNVSASATGELTGLDGEVDLAPGKGYPLFFKNYALKQPAPRGSNVDISPNDQTLRELRACDIVLTAPRIGTVQSISFGDPIGDGQFIQISTSLNTSAFDAYRDTPYRLASFSRWEGVVEPSYLDRLLGQAVEPTTDEIKIVTVWAVSPMGAGPSDVPGPGWTLYAEYNCFFNLMHVSKNQPAAIPPPPITFITPLAAGAGNVLIASYLDPLNDASNAISEMFAQASYKGTFYSI